MLTTRVMIYANDRTFKMSKSAFNSICINVTSHILFSRVFDYYMIVIFMNEHVCLAFIGVNSC